MSFRSLKNVLRSAREATRAVAFLDGKSICWGRFLSDVDALRIKLLAAKELDCAICCEDSYLFCVAFFAAVYADKKIVLPGNHQPAMLSDLSAHFDFIIHDGLVQNNFQKQQLLLPLAAQQTVDLAFSELDLAQIQVTLFTSGSSGLPKAINKTLLMLDTEIAELEVEWGEQLAGCNIVSTVSHQHIYGLLFRVLWPLCAGRVFQRNDLIFPEQVVSCAQQNTTLISSPALLKRLQENEESGQYRAIFSSGGPLSSAAVQQCRRLFKQYPFEVFGSTETGGIGYRQQFEEAAPWTLFFGISAQLGENDCLRLCSPWIDAKSWYQTSDQGQLLDNKQFILRGRVDRVVKIEEKRISLVDVEQRLNQLEWIEESAVLVVDDIHRLSLGAVINLTEQGQALMSTLGKGKFWIEIRQALRSWLEPVGIPRHYRVVSEIPVNKQGKRLHRDIAQLFSHENGIKNVTP